MTATVRRELAQLLVPRVSWDASGGFAGAMPGIDAALEAGVGGFVFTGGEQDAVRPLAKLLQQRSRQPLLLGAALERGAGQRFAGATGLPPVAAIAALDDLEALRRAARLTAREARTMGINWNLAPSADLDAHDDNPVVGTSAMARAPQDAARRVTAWIEACQGEGVLACVKHFPGLGRLRHDPQDAAAGPARVDATAELLKEQDLVPFRAAIAAGVASLMAAPVAYPALDPSGAPAARSREVLQWFLRQQLRFDNLIVSDALSAAGLRDGLSEPEAAVEALRAGCDVLLAPTDVGATLDALVAATASGVLDPDRIRQSVRRRLKWAQWASPPNEWRRPSGADTAWGALLADRVLRTEHGPLPPLGAVTEVVVVDDDGDGASVPRTVLADALRLAGVDARLAEGPTAASGGPLVVALFADDQPGKGRTALLPATEARLAALVSEAARAGRGTIVVGLGDPRRAAAAVGRLEAPVPTLIAWSGDRVMQQAAARHLAKRRTA
jgi:beta-glucosidase-like glycosyl hydrolase